MNGGRRVDRGQAGQVVPIFGIMALFLVGIVALAIDFGLLTNQHRNLQAFADEAALAGVQQLNPSLIGSQSGTAETNARRTAFVYLRDNLAGGGGSAALPIASLSSGSYATCWGSAATIFTTDIAGCTLPPPFSNYTVSICTPGETSATAAPCSTQTGQAFNTLSVRITESIATSLAGVLGNSLVTAGGFSEGIFTASSSSNGTPGSITGQLPFTVYTNGCLQTGNKLEIVQGDIYIGQCSLTYQSNGQAGFCAESNAQTAGNIEFGPLATVPVNPVPLSNQPLASCLASSGGQVSAMGEVTQLQVPPTPPAFTPPPGYSLFTLNGTYAAATANNPCVNGTVLADGTVGSDCFNPGYYTTMTGIANNLNPGVYYVTGDPACNASTTTTSCNSVIFSGDTMNANWSDVRDACWASPNNPNQGIFQAPCPDGFVIDPTAAPDPQCAASSITPLAPPVFSLAQSGNSGNLDPSGTGTTYYVRVTALNSFGESTSTEQSLAISLGQGQRSMKVTITAETGASGYNIYVGTAPNTELLYVPGNVASGPTIVTTTGSGIDYPRFDTSSCKTGFRNIPRSPDASQNNGVTFVLFNKASVCMNPNCQSPGGSTPTVLLSPFCSTFRPGLPVNAPDVALALPAGISAGTPCTPPYVASGTYMNDGAFIAYGPTQGVIEASGLNTQVGIVGTIDLPSASLVVTQNAVFELVPGQVIAHDLNIQTGNKLNPSFYYPCCPASNSGTTPVLVGAQQPPALYLIR